ncbi:putative dynein heavy chain [Trypanosoma vivax]|nr:putative dynein heavy chain [Trypanosoma vivax]
MRRSRSAEQTARALLSSAVRYDTWECKASKEGAGNNLVTIELCWNQLPEEEAFRDVVALHMTLYDAEFSLFVGATHVVSTAEIGEPVIFQTRVDDMLLVVEVVAPADQPVASANRQALFWGSLSVSQLATATAVELQPGSAQVLALDKKSWEQPTENMHKIGFSARVVEDITVTQLMSRLVPPGVMVTRSFTENTPESCSSLFRCVVRNIQLSPTTQEEEWWSASTEWRVAAVAHNGYQQLGQGCEVGLVFEDEFCTTGSSNLDSERGRRKGSGRLLRSVSSFEIGGLPVHSATSLVLAIRRKRAEEKEFEVLGFCVFPLCVMPLKDRDLHVENFPTLHGPFSCRDPRMLMLESSSPYGKVPIVVTLTVEYHDTGVPCRVSEQRLRTPRGKAEKKYLRGDDKGKGSPRRGDTQGTWIDGDASFSMEDHVPAAQSMEILSTADAVAPQVASHYLANVKQGEVEEVVATRRGRKSASPDIFKMLCNVMEELRRLREMQEVALKDRRSRVAQARRLDKSGERLDDAVDDIRVLDLAPTSVAISWDVRCRLEEDLQPILHPVHGTPVSDCMLSSSGETASLYGARFEGLTLDISIDVPKDVCFIFSFGSLPTQTIGPVRAVNIDTSLHGRTFKLYEGTQRAGVLWCEPLGSAQDPIMHKYKQQENSTLYIHIYNALTMFYIATATLKLSHFRRPYNAECACAPMDLQVHRDLTLSEMFVPPKVLPIMRDAGQMHVTIFCASSGIPVPAVSEMRVVEPPRGSRTIVAKKLPLAELLELDVQRKKHREGEHAAEFGGNDISRCSATVAATAPGGEVLHSTLDRGFGEETVGPATPPGAGPTGTNTTLHGRQEDIHWRRAQYIKQVYDDKATTAGQVSVLPPNVGDMEFRLRYLEKRRDELKARKIGEALVERLTVHHHLTVASFHPERVESTFKNPFSKSMQFTVEIDSGAAGALEVVSSPSFHMEPHESTTVMLVVRLNEWNTLRSMRDEKGDFSCQLSSPMLLRAYIYTAGHEMVRIIDIHTSVGLPIVHRRHEIFAPAGTRVTKKLFSRLFSPSMFNATMDRTKLLASMSSACAHITITSKETVAEANAVLDPITQAYVMAWEEVSVTTNVPSSKGEQRLEYVTLFEDAAMSKVIETWELSIFACEAVTSRELPFGQTTTVALPSSGVEALYCSDTRTRVERRGESYLLHLRPAEVGTQKLLLHMLTDNHLAKTILTVPTVYPTPTFVQTIELGLADVKAPVFRRIKFVHYGPGNDCFTIHHNYKYQLRVSPKQFALSPEDCQFINLQIDMLTLPEGKTEGRWPMWIFINNSSDKTVESYLLHVILRAHRVLYSVA